LCCNKIARQIAQCNSALNNNQFENWSSNYLGYTMFYTSILVPLLILHKKNDDLNYKVRTIKTLAGGGGRTKVRITLGEGQKKMSIVYFICTSPPPPHN
jgi:hypothetical protein